MSARKPRRRGVTPDPLLLELMASLGAAPVDRAYIVDEDDEGVQVLGLCESGQPPRVTINEALLVVPTILHELIHRVRPEWSERAVRARESQLFHRLTHAEIDRIYSLYLATATPRRKRTKTA